MPDRLSECQADMRLIEQAADDIERTLEAVGVTSSESVWAGPVGDRSRNDWTLHRLAIRAALNDVRAQIREIAARCDVKNSFHRAVASRAHSRKHSITASIWSSATQ